MRLSIVLQQQTPLCIRSLSTIHLSRCDDLVLCHFHLSLFHHVLRWCTSLFGRVIVDHTDACESCGVE